MPSASRCPSEPRVRHERRMIDQAFDAAQTFREREQMRVLEKTPRAGEIGFQNRS